VIYRQPILAYVSRWERDRHQAEDLAQKFLARMLEKNPFQGFERRGAKFRSFLLRCLKNFLRDSYANLAEPLGMAATAPRKFVHDLRERHHEHFRQEVTDIVARDQILTSFVLKNSS
jgi:DNA-directed RNA polymerase specialized sigma24 family protein